MRLITVTRLKYPISKDGGRKISLKDAVMNSEIAARLAARGITLPQVAAPAANYVPFVQTGNLLFISGQLPIENGKLAQTGLLGRDVTLEQGQRAAELCAINILAAAAAALGGDLGCVRRIVRITCMVASTPDFHEHHLVANGASNLLVDILGEAGKHARVAVGMAALPLDASVEIDVIMDVA
jgi:enamine deaminase RidA (YjgF/YER057c/UK114 family)